MTDASGNADQIADWNAAAGETWETLQDRLDLQLEPLGQRAQQALAPQPGERILDIGCGAGQTTLELARAVAPRLGRVASAASRRYDEGLGSRKPARRHTCVVLLLRIRASCYFSGPSDTAPGSSGASSCGTVRSMPASCE